MTSNSAPSQVIEFERDYLVNWHYQIPSSKERSNSSSIKSVWNQTPIIKPSELTFGDQIGRGCFSTVYRGTCRGISVAIKVHNQFERIRNSNITEIRPHKIRRTV